MKMGILCNRMLDVAGLSSHKRRMIRTRLVGGVATRALERGPRVAYAQRWACGLTLILAWGCSDDSGGATTPISDAGDAAPLDDAGGTRTDAAVPTSQTSSTSVESSSSSTETSSEVSTQPPMVDTHVDSGTTSSSYETTDGNTETSATSVTDTSSTEDQTPVLPEACGHLPAPAVEVDELPGFTNSEDFAFDEHGNFVGVDYNGNLVRIDITGETSLWVPAIGGTAGIDMLPDGSVVICSLTTESLVRVYPDTSTVTILGGLEYPNGLTIGPDGFVYVAENNAGRVRRVNPDTGDYTIVAMGLHGANGVAFGNDPKLMYVGSFEGSGVYKVELGEPGELGHASVLSRPHGSTLAEPRLACPDQVVGSPCFMPTGSRGQCTQAGDVVDCFHVDECPRLPDGTSCDFPDPGECKNDVCVPACSDANVWDTCRLPYGDEVGVCAVSSLGSLTCKYPDPCDQLEAGAECEFEPNVPGTCVAGYGGFVECQVKDTCGTGAEGDACTTSWGAPGECTPQGYYPGYGDAGVSYLACYEVSSCKNLQDGDSCETSHGLPGECYYGWCHGLNPCEDASVGDVCVDPYSQEAGSCKDLYGSMYCVQPGPCDGLNVDDACVDGDVAGVCTEYFPGADVLVCIADPCQGAAEGDLCSVSWSGVGTCTNGDDGLYCKETPPCEGMGEGALCFDEEFTAGSCAASEQGMWCDTPQPCDGLAPGDSCETKRVPGTCVIDSGELVCRTACDGRDEGDPCTTSYGIGTCKSNGYMLECQGPNPCVEAAEGDACRGKFGPGSCTLVQDYYSPPGPTPGGPSEPPGDPIIVGPQPEPQGGGSALPPAPAFSDAGYYTPAGTDAGYYAPAGADAGATMTVDGGNPWDAGYPQPTSHLECLPTSDCTGKPEGEACVPYGNTTGVCMLGQCQPSRPGGIDGLGVDACGNVYATEYVYGNVWRISPDGATQLISNLDSGWIPNLEWGRGEGGFEKDIMYVADRDQGRLFAVHVGVPGPNEPVVESTP